MRAVHFGAGNIGRGFIGWLLARSGYEVCFVDVNPGLVSQIQQRKGYAVRLLASEATTERVEGVTALHANDREAVADAIASADLVTTSVGPRSLPHIAPAIADGLRRRHGRTLPVIACENMVDAGDALRVQVELSLGGATAPAQFPNGVVDRIVPNYQHQPGDDPLLVAVEPFYEWLVDRSALTELVHPVEGLRLVDNLGAYTERKLFGLNTGHAIVAYLGYLRGSTYIHEAVRDPFVRVTLISALAEAGVALVQRHGFTEAEQSVYAAELLKRFGNPALADQVVRVGRDPLRKLSPGDRLVAPARMALAQGILPRSLARGIAAGLLFTAPEDPVALSLGQRLEAEGLAQVARSVLGLEEESILWRLVEEEHALLADLARRPRWLEQSA